MALSAPINTFCSGNNKREKFIFNVKVFFIVANLQILYIKPVVCLLLFPFHSVCLQDSDMLLQILHIRNIVPNLIHLMVKTLNNDITQSLVGFRTIYTPLVYWIYKWAYFYVRALSWQLTLTSLVNLKSKTNMKLSVLHCYIVVTLLLHRFTLHLHCFNPHGVVKRLQVV